jgi:hypothetical protein
MNIKNKIINAITAHPKLVMFGIGLAVTFVVETVIGIVDHNQAFAIVTSGAGSNVSTSGGN